MPATVGAECHNCFRAHPHPRYACARARASRRGIASAWGQSRRSGLRHRLHTYGPTRPSRHQAFPLPRPETGGRETPPPHTKLPTVALAREKEPSALPSSQREEGQGEGASAHLDERGVVLTNRTSVEPATGWVPKPAAMLAIEVTWPEMSAAEGRPYELWTMASCWDHRMAEKVAGFGGVILQSSASLSLVAFGLPQPLEQLPQNAVQAALAIRHLAAEAQTSAGQSAGTVVWLAGHLRTLPVAEETGASPGRWLDEPEPAVAATRQACRHP